MLKKILKGGTAALVVAGAVWGFALTRDGALVTPAGEGIVTTNAGEFEAFPLPDYTAKFIKGDYKSYFVEVEEGIKIHVLEVGEGYPVYAQHGMPTSGLLYRDIAAALPQAEYRVIMPTLVGLGFSSKIPASQHSIENHFSWMNTLLNKMALEELIFVGHDWGGAIGAGALARSPELMQGMVVLNTVFDVPKVPREVSTALKLVQTPLLGELMLEGITSVFAQLPGFQNDPASMPQEVLDLYEKPVKDSGNMKAPLAMARMSVLAPDDAEAPVLRVTEDYLIENVVPTEIVWGKNDPQLGGRLADMQAVVPNATVIETDGGYFLQEEVLELIATSIVNIRKQIQQK